MAMDKSAADAYVYAKSSGMLVRSFTKDRARALFSLKTLHELWTLLFKKEVPPVPETLLAKEIENEALKSFVADFDALLKCYAKPKPLLTALLHFYEYENLKQLGTALALGEETMPQILDISPYQIINYKKWPDVKQMTAGTIFSWYTAAPSFSEQKDVDYKLDSQYIKEVWNAANEENLECKNEILNLIGEKFIIDNVVWALRLKLYYGMSYDEILQKLAYSSAQRSEDDIFIQQAKKVLTYETDDYEKWSQWKYNEFLNPREAGDVWNVDPRWIYNSYQKKYVEKAWRLFHLHPFTDCPLVCWFIIKRHELDLIRTAAESIRLSVSSSQALAFAGFSEE